MIKLFKKLEKKYFPLILVILILVCVQVYLDLKIPDYMIEITKIVTTGSNATNEIISVGFKMLLCAFGSLISAFIVGYIVAVISSAFGKVTRKNIFNKIMGLSEDNIKQFKTSSLITRTTNDVTQIQTLIATGLQVALKAPILSIWALTKILNKNLSWTILTGGILLAMIVMVIIIIVLAIPKIKKIQKLTDNLNKVTGENLGGIRVIRAFNAENYQQTKFDETNIEVKEANLFVGRVMSLISPVLSFLLPLLNLGIYVIGAILIGQAAMMDKFTLFSDMIVFSSYAVQIIMSFMMLIFIFIIYPRANVSSKRIIELLDKKNSIKNGSIKEVNNLGTIEFKNVTFKYADASESVLDNISFKINKGETVAIIGSTGSGKSTLINLIVRFHDVTSGSILIDGINIKEYDLEQLYKKIGYISQKPVLFSGDVISNLIIGDNEDISEDKAKEILSVAQGLDFIMEKENEVHTHVSQNGTNFSGGQKQRINIARAIARNPEIYIFDDSFSALDYKTDADLRRELNIYTKDSTKIIVAQRIGTIKNSDTIIVLDNGKIAGIGKHSDLLKDCRVYKEIAYSQLSKEELDA